MADARTTFIQALYPYAQRFQQQTGIPAAWAIAMAANETGWDASNPVLFGIKGTSPSGQGGNFGTWEDYGQGRININDQFATYKDYGEAFNHLAQEMLSGRWQGAPRDSLQGFLSYLTGGNREGAKWATDPAYAQKIGSIVGTIGELGLPVQGQTVAAGGQTAMGTPTPIGDPEEYWVYTQDGKPATSVTDPRNMGGLGGFGADYKNAYRVKRETFSDGKIYETRYSADGQPMGRVLVDVNAQLAAQWRQENPTDSSSPLDDAYKEAQIAQIYANIAKNQAAPGDSPEDIAYKKAQTDMLRAQLAKLQQPALPDIGNTTQPYYNVQGDNGPELRNNPNYRPPAPTRDPNQPAPRYPEDAEYARLRNQQLQQQLQNPLQLAMQQQNEALAAIQQKLAAGEIDVAEANRLMSLTRANLDSTLMGTTPWQQKTQQQNLARGVMGDRMQTGASMANNLLTGAGSIYGNILQSSGAPTNFDPMLLAKGFVNDMGGGPEMGELAKAILSGAMKPQGF